jgi:hypothetical protein
MLSDFTQNKKHWPHVDFTEVPPEKPGPCIKSASGPLLTGAISY